MNTYVICYDIEDDRDRLRVARCLESYGDRVQYSVFEVHLRGEQQLAELCAELQAIVGDSSDIRFYRLTADSLADSRCLNGERIGIQPAAIII